MWFESNNIITIKGLLFQHDWKLWIKSNTNIHLHWEPNQQYWCFTTNTLPLCYSTTHVVVVTISAKILIKFLYLISHGPSASVNTLESLGDLV